MVIHACPPFSFSRVLLWCLIYDNIFYGLCQATVSIELSRGAEFLPFLTFPIEKQEQPWYNISNYFKQRGLLYVPRNIEIYFIPRLS